MCSVCIIQLLSLSRTPTLLYAAVCLWDSVNYISSVLAGSPSGSASIGCWMGRLQGWREERGLFLPVRFLFLAASPQQWHLTWWCLLVSGSSFFFFFDTWRTSLIVPLRSTSPGSATSSAVWAPPLHELSKRLGSDPRPLPLFLQP